MGRRPDGRTSDWADPRIIRVKVRPLVLIWHVSGRRTRATVLAREETDLPWPLGCGAEPRLFGGGTLIVAT